MELIQQNFMTMLRAWPEAPAGIYSAGLSRRDIRAQILFAGIQSIHRHAYQVQRRVALARRLIAQGQPLAEVAAACGFADQSHMTRQFVRKYGVSPGMVAAAR
jgi:AraC-like DNA-binding protein